MKNEKQKVALISVFAAIFLTTFKFGVGWWTNSLGILSEALHSGLDLVAAVITLYAVKASVKEADTDHHYGHGKIENFSALIETFLLFITCMWIVYEAVHRLMSGNVDIKISIFSYVVVITSIVIDVWRSKKLHRAAVKYNSQALEADALHFSTDIWSSSVVLFGLICVTIGKTWGLPWLYYGDSIAALMVALIVIHVSWKMGKKAVDSLLDKVPFDVAKDIESVIKNYDKIACYHGFKVRQSGSIYYVDVTVHVTCNTLVEAHELSDDLEKEIKKVQPFTDTTIHVEPDNHKH